MTDRWTEEIGGKNGDGSWTEISEEDVYAERSGLVIPGDEVRLNHSPFPGQNRNN